MNTEEGVVIRIDAKNAWIKTVKTGACESCSSRGACNTLGGGKEMEVEAMISKDLSYLTEEYVPMKLKDKKQWLD